MSARTGQDTGPYYAYDYVSRTIPFPSTLRSRIPFTAATLSSPNELTFQSGRSDASYVVI